MKKKVFLMSDGKPKMTKQFGLKFKKLFFFIFMYQNKFLSYNAPSGNDPKSSLPEPLKLFLDFFLEKILKIEKPMQIFSQKCLYALLKAPHFKNKLLINLNKGE